MRCFAPKWGVLLQMRYLLYSTQAGGAYLVALDSLITLDPKSSKLKNFAIKCMTFTTFWTLFEHSLNHPTRKERWFCELSWKKVLLRYHFDTLWELLETHRSSRSVLVHSLRKCSVLVKFWVFWSLLITLLQMRCFDGSWYASSRWCLSVLRYWSYFSSLFELFGSFCECNYESVLFSCSLSYWCFVMFGELICRCSW